MVSVYNFGKHLKKIAVVVVIPVVAVVVVVVIVVLDLPLLVLMPLLLLSLLGGLCCHRSADSMHLRQSIQMQRRIVTIAGVTDAATTITAGARCYRHRRGNIISIGSDETARLSYHLLKSPGRRINRWKI